MGKHRELLLAVFSQQTKKQQQTNRCVSFIGCPQVSIEALLHDADHGSGPCMLL